MFRTTLWGRNYVFNPSFHQRRKLKTKKWRKFPKVIQEHQDSMASLWTPLPQFGTLLKQEKASNASNLWHSKWLRENKNRTCNWKSLLNNHPGWFHADSSCALFPTLQHFNRMCCFKSVVCWLKWFNEGNA